MSDSIFGQVWANRPEDPHAARNFVAGDRVRATEANIYVANNDQTIEVGTEGTVAWASGRIILVDFDAEWTDGADDDVLLTCYPAEVEKVA